MLRAQLVLVLFQPNLAVRLTLRPLINPEISKRREENQSPSDSLRTQKVLRRLRKIIT